MQTLQTLLPVQLESPTQADTVYNIKSLASEYTAHARSSTTRAYMKELHEIAKLSGNSRE